MNEPAPGGAEEPLSPLPEVAVHKPLAREQIGTRELVGLGMICVAADLLLYGVWGGLGGALLLLAVPLLLVAATRTLPRTPRTIGMAVVLALLAVRSIWQTSAGSAMLGAGVLLAFAIGLRARETFIPDLVVSAAKSFESGWLHFLDSVRALRLRLLPRSGRSWSIAVPVLVVLVFLGVFAAANPVVEQVLDRLFATLSEGSGLSAAMGHVVFWIFVAYLGCVLVRPQFIAAPWNDRLGAGHRLVPLDADAPTDTRYHVSRNVLWAVNALFLAYNALDALYLWAGEPPAGIDHTAYAHRGTVWLTVGLLLCTIVLGVMFRGAHLTGPRAARMRLLAYAWAGQGFVLAAGTLRRIQLYVDFSGLTFLRVVGIVGSVLVIAGLGLVIAKVARGSTMLWLVRRQLDAFALALILLAVTPVDTLVTSFNVDRIAAGEHRPILGLFEQDISAEGLPGLLPLLDHPDETVRAGVAAYLIQRSDELRSTTRSTAWTEFQGASSWAQRELEDALPRLRALVLTPDDISAALVRLRDLARIANDLQPGDRDY